MAAVAEPLLTTVERYRQLPERDDVLQELHWGQLITLTRPKARHVKLQSRLVRLLRPKAEHLGYVESELPFRALPEYDLRAADVAFVSKQRWDEVPDDDDLRGAPELVIEVLSRSNTPAKIQELAALCLSAGTHELWVIDAKRETVTVTSRQGASMVYGCEDRIPLSLFGGNLAVSEIFARAAK
jgi:Uma2 family endonuclease